jgi:hypothetical protein
MRIGDLMMGPRAGRRYSRSRVLLENRRYSNRRACFPLDRIGRAADERVPFGDGAGLALRQGCSSRAERRLRAYQPAYGASDVLQ